MTVYVDDLRPTGLKGPMAKACHMMADTPGELEAMARRLELLERWKHGDHYDLSASKRHLAVAFGAVKVDVRYLVELRRGRLIPDAWPDHTNPTPTPRRTPTMKTPEERQAWRLVGDIFLHLCDRVPFGRVWVTTDPVTGTYTALFLWEFHATPKRGPKQRFVFQNLYPTQPPPADLARLHPDSIAAAILDQWRNEAPKELAVDICPPTIGEQPLATDPAAESGDVEEKPADDPAANRPLVEHWQDADPTAGIDPAGPTNGTLDQLDDDTPDHPGDPAA